MTVHVAVMTLVFTGVLNALSAPEVQLVKGVSVELLSQQEGAKFLGSPDAFVKSLSPFDRSARLQVGRPVGQEEYLNHVRAQVIDWKAEEEKKLRQCLKKVRELLRDIKLPWPKRIVMIKTTGKEEGGAAYTRRNGIVLPVDRLKQAEARLERLLLHELFHVLSRANPGLATRLYGVIGFEKAPDLNFPEKLLPRKLTNPDAPFSRHVIEVEHKKARVKVAPILYSRAANYDADKGGPFFRYLIFRLLVLDSNDLSRAARNADGGLTLLKPDEVKGFREKIGRNTGYIIHPEETMADNFVFLVMSKSDLPNPEIINKMRKILAEKTD